MKKITRNADYTKQYNRKLLLKLLLKKNMSRADLARDMGLTRASISIIAEEMLKSGILTELAPVSAQRGRSPVPLSVNPEAFYAFGVFLNRKKCSAGLVDISGRCDLLTEIPLTGRETPGPVIESLCDAMRNSLKGRPDIRSRLLGIGISCPGPLKLAQGTILNPPGFEGWHQTPMAREFSARMELPAFVWDNADALAIYNHRFGPHRDISDFLLLLVDTGIGSGIVMKDKIYHGAGAASPELGHISIRYDGRPCSCGNQGCLEAYAAIPNLLSKAGWPYPDWPQVIAHLKEPAAQTLLETEADYLAAGLITALNLFDLRTIYLAGDILTGFEEISSRIQKRLQGPPALREKAPVLLLPSHTARDYETIAGANIIFSMFLDSVPPFSVSV